MSLSRKQGSDQVQNREQTRKLGEIAAVVCEEWKLIDLEDMIMGDSVDGSLEHIIHEMSHAASLGISWGRLASKRIGDVIRGSDKHGNFIAGKDTPMAIAEETRTWAIEWNVWKLFDLPFEWRDLEVAAEVQGCNSGEIQSMLEHQYIQDLANETYQKTLDFLRNFKSGS